MLDEEDYGVRVVRAFDQFSVGRVIKPYGAHRQALIRGKWVEVIEPPAENLRTRQLKASLAKAAIKPPTE